MSNNNLFRIGGFAVILSIVLSLASMALPGLLALGALAIAVLARSRRERRCVYELNCQSSAHIVNWV